MAIVHKLYGHSYAPCKRVAIDLTISENPLGASKKAYDAIVESAHKAHLYPYNGSLLIKRLAKKYAISQDNIILGAGACQLLEDILKVYALGKGIVAPTATFPESIACITTLGGYTKQVPLDKDFGINISGLINAVDNDIALIHICNPNNPTGLWCDLEHIIKLADLAPVPILISEAGADFIGQSIIDKGIHQNIIAVRSFSKAYGLAGLRIGYAIAESSIIEKLKQHLRTYKASNIAIAAAIAALQDQEHLAKSVSYIIKEKKWLMHEMRNLGFEVVPSQGQNFIAKVPAKFGNAKAFCKHIKRYGIAVVDCSLYEGLEQYIRIAPQKHDINKQFISILTRIMEI